MLTLQLAMPEGMRLRDSLIPSPPSLRKESSSGPEVWMSTFRSVRELKGREAGELLIAYQANVMENGNLSYTF
jgi:hypothetical protein